MSGIGKFGRWRKLYLINSHIIFALLVFFSLFDVNFIYFGFGMCLPAREKEDQEFPGKTYGQTLDPMGVVLNQLPILPV